MDKKKKSPRKSSAPKIKDLDVQQRKLALIKQKKCDAVALHIVRKLIDCPVEEDVFIQSLKYLNQCHYQDIVVERAITKLCGYPICGSKIIDVPNKKFYISTKKNKVYDITERKNYCSNFCYKAGVYIKDQMLSSPLWFRDKEEIPEFHLLPKTETGIPGQEIDQGIIKLDVEEPEQNFTSISEFTQDMMNKIPENVYDQINVEENTSVSTQDTKNKEKSRLDVSETQNQYFSNLLAPSLADILKQNAEYFQNESNCETVINTSENKDNKLKVTSDKIEQSNENLATNIKKEKANNKVVENKAETFKIKSEPSTSKSENYKVGFNRTVINTKSNESKGILKKSKKKSSQKKRVSFSSENSIQELDEQLPPNNESTDVNQIYIKSETSKTGDKNERRYKNTNVIGIVQERSAIFKHNTENCEDVDEINKNIVEDKNKLLNNDYFKEEVNNDNDLKKEINNKENRLSRLKNSSTFKKANHLSKPNSHPLNSSNCSISSFTNLQSRLETCLSEWFTFETALFLYGEEYVKKIISEKSFKHYLNKKKNLELDDNKQKQYEEICKRLNLMEFADQKFDETVTGKKRRPLPRYEDLRNASEHLDLRVQAFYAGCYEMYEEDVEDTDTDTESVKDEDTDKSSVVQGPPAVLPLVDNKDVMATRRKIFLMSVSRAISSICELLQESPNKLLSEIKHLINTFDFTAKNIVFKSKEWQLVTILLIQILSVRDTELRTALDKKEVSSYLSSLARQFELEDTYIEEVLNKVHVQNLLDECLRKDCINIE